MMLEEQPKDLADSLSFRLIDDQSAACGSDIVTKYRCASDPLAFAARRRHLVARAFPYDFPFELGEGKQDVERQTTERRSGIELLRHGNEANRALIEPVHQAREIEERPAQPVNLVYNDAVDSTRIDVFEQSLQGRAVEIAAGEATVIIMSRD